MVKNRLALGAILLCLMFATFPLAAQDSGSDNSSVYYVRSMVITQVAMGDYGYRVTYLNGRGKLHYAYIPHDWFKAAASKGERIDVWSHSAPYMEVYYKDGGFSHVRLFLIPTFDHVSWTVLSDDEDVESNFQSDTLDINYD